MFFDWVLLGAAAAVWSIVLIIVVKLIQVIWYWIGGRIKLRIDPESAPYLQGMTLDWQVDGLNEGFKIINPNEKYRCGCGESIGF